MSDKILNPTLVIAVGEGDEREEFTFRVPSPLEKARLGIREAAIRRMLDPTGGGWAVGIDDETYFLLRGMTVLELLLEKANVTWPYTEVKPERGEAELRVDISKFPPGKEGVIIELGRRFQEELDTFHRDRTDAYRSTAAKAVAGQLHPASLEPVSSRAA